MVLKILNCINNFNILAILRGYKKIQQGENPIILSQINAKLTVTLLKVSARKIPNIFLSGVIDKSEICLRQLLLMQLGGRHLNAQILRNISNKKLKISYPLPKEWVLVLESHGLKVNRKTSALLFNTYCFTRFLKDLILMFRESINQKLKTKLTQEKPYASFIGLTANNLPRTSTNSSYDIVSWYLKWSDRSKKVRSILHDCNVPKIFVKDVEVFFSNQPALILYGLKNFLIHNFWCGFIFTYALFEVIKGNIAFLIMYRHLVAAHKVSIVPNEHIAVEYFFSCSEHIYRPFWTYVVQKRGALVTLYYYSASMPFEFKGHTPEFERGLQSMTWQRILTFSSNQHIYLNKAVGKNCLILKVPPIYFTDFEAELPEIDKRSIAIFDVTPVRLTERAFIGAPDSYRISSIGIKFLDELYDVLTKAGYKLVWKRKRSAIKNANKSYMKFATEFESRPGVTVVHADVSAIRIIDKCFASVSMSFTSTGLLAQYAGKQSVFFDPTSLLSKTDEAAQGVEVISGKKELITWIEILKKS
jgi:polysaccharide biosynthesis PFTS motif protein